MLYSSLETALGKRESIVLLIATFMTHVVKENVVEKLCERQI